MSRPSRTAIALILSLACLAPTADAHVLKERSFDLLGPFMAPFDEIEALLKDSPDTATGSTTLPGVADPAPAPAPAVTTSPTQLPTIPAPPQPRMMGDAVEIINTYNKGGVSHGHARSPTFTLTEPMMLTYLQTYHWNGGRGAAAPGQIGLKGQGVWQAEGRPGMLDTPNAEWIATPQVILQPGTYTVIDSVPETWAHNSGSQDIGFVVVRAAPISGVALSVKLTERQALEKVATIARFKDWVLAVRANGNSVVYDLTEDPTGSCTETSCNWCFRMQEDTPSHRTYFETYCVNANSGDVSAQIE